MRRGRIPFERTCVVCRRKAQKPTLLRFALSAGGGPAFDPSGHAKGRGMYLCPQARCVELAFAGKGPLRKFRGLVDLSVLKSEVGEVLATSSSEGAAGTATGRQEQV